MNLTNTVTPRHVSAFREDLPEWFERVRRSMPWRDTNDPYRIWLSEVMLQQTRVDQAWPYYERFLKAFPTVYSLAGAELDDVLIKWEGLGYYARARNLHRAAKMVCLEFEGRIPQRYEDIRRLPGVGPYTAAAVLSIAFGRPHAVLDGNVTRVLTRVFAISDDVRSARTRRQLQAIADAVLDPADPGSHNEAMMELGATVCTPTAPSCGDCPLRPICDGAATGEPESFPFSRAKAAVPHYDVAIGIVYDEARHVLIQRRPEEGLLGGLWEFPGGKRQAAEPMEETCRRELREELGIEVAVDDLFHRLSHAYSHFKVTLHAFRCRITAGTPRPQPGIPIAWVSIDSLDAYAFPRANRRLIELLSEEGGSMAAGG